jgi:hypothetical protein
LKRKSFFEVFSEKKIAAESTAAFSAERLPKRLTGHQKGGKTQIFIQNHSNFSLK